VRGIEEIQGGIEGGELDWIGGQLERRLWSRMEGIGWTI